MVWKTDGLVPGDAWSKELDGSKDLVGDWVEHEVRQLQYQDQASAAASYSACTLMTRKAAAAFVRRLRLLRSSDERYRDAIDMRLSCTTRWSALLLCMRRCCSRVPAGCRRPPQSYERGAGRVRRRLLRRHRRRPSPRVADQRQSRWRCRCIEALQDGRLLFSADDKKVFIRDAPATRCSTPRPASRPPACAAPISSRCASTTACAARSRPRSAA